MNSSNSSTLSLEEENGYEFEKTGIQTFVYLLILSIIGTIGNLHVIVVYSIRYKANIYKIFILCLAGVDLLACTFCIPSVLFIVIHPNTVQSSAFCKIVRASVYFCGPCSLSLLDVIAVERYRKVWQATRTQFTLRTAKIVCASVIALTFTFAAIPAMVIYGINRKKTYYHSLEGYECTVLNEFKNSTFAKIYRALLFLVFCFLLVVCVLLYIMVGRKIYAHQKKYQTQKKFRLKCGFSKCPNSDAKMSFAGDKKDSKQCTQKPETSRCDRNTLPEYRNIPLAEADDAHVNENTSQEEKVTNNDSTFRSSSTLQVQSPNASTTLKSDNKTKHTLKNEEYATLTGSSVADIHRIKRSNELTRSRNITFIFLVVSVISFGGYIPYLIITVIRNVDWQQYDAFSNSAPALRLFLGWMVFLNNAVNPLVYGFIDNKFRKECKEIYLNVKKCVCSAE